MSVVRIVVLVLGAVYVLIGLMGFLGDPIVMDATHEDMPSTEGDLLGIFPINAAHNVVHLVIGAALLFGATRHDRAVMMAWIIGIAYAAVGLLGIFAPDTFGLMPIGGADVLLHFATAAILIGVAFLDRGAERRTV